MTAADLRNADMRGARLKRPYLTRAKLDGLKFDEDLREVISRYAGKEQTDRGTR